MKKIRFAIICDQEISSGGGYQQSLNAAMLAKALPEDLAEVIFFSTSKTSLLALAEHGIDAIHFKQTYFSKINRRLRFALEALELYQLVDFFGAFSSLEKTLKIHQVDLVYFLSPNPLAKDLGEINYITTIWDLCHRDNPEFPEIRRKHQFEKREAIYKSILPKATAIFVDSDIGKENVIRRYGVDVERVYVMPFQAMTSVRKQSNSINLGISISERYKINVPYVFYPAQFWAHKNHVYLLDGLKKLDSLYGLHVGAIFSGGDQGSMQYVKDYVETLGLSDRVRFAGFVPNEEIPALYKQSLALVMPTYFGPTNLPPIEAFELGVPVLYSNLPGLREQVGDAALLMDLSDPGSMALHLSNLIRNSDLRENLKAKGYAKLDDFKELTKINLLTSVVQNFKLRRICWR